MTIGHPSVLILAGGRSARMGRDKALLPWGAASSLLAHVIAGFAPLREAGHVDELLIACGAEPRYEAIAAAAGAKLVLDEAPDLGPVGGLLAGLRSANGDPVLVVGCDMPTLRPGVLIHLLLRFAAVPGAEVAAVRSAHGWEPMPGVYGRACVDKIVAAMAAGRRGLSGFFPAARIVDLTESELRELDPGLESLKNCNTPAEWTDALRAAVPRE